IDFHLPGASFSAKAGAKVQTFSELANIFEIFLQKKCTFAPFLTSVKRKTHKKTYKNDNFGVQHAPFRGTGRPFPERPAGAARPSTPGCAVAQLRLDARAEGILHRRTGRIVPRNLHNGTSIIPYYYTRASVKQRT
ncbi:MAG: hypothetical protein IJ527_07695, partial [Prevotella sp.]|nr:hypothetical protein [Prevotella sp.]